MHAVAMSTTTLRTASSWLQFGIIRGVVTINNFGGKGIQEPCMYVCEKKVNSSVGSYRHLSLHTRLFQAIW